MLILMLDCQGGQLTFIFVLFLGMLLYVNELQTKEKQKFSGIKN